MVSGQSFHGRVLKGLLYDTLRRRNEQTPSFKHQASGKLQAQSVKRGNEGMEQWSDGMGISESSKLQPPSFRETPSTKVQMRARLRLVDSLVLGVWCLEFLAFFFMKPTALVSGQSEVRTKPREC